MTLTLEISASSVGSPSSTRHVFGEEGGTIGRASTCSWVLAHGTVSLQHAQISWRDGVFYIQDTDSRNGVAINSPESELVPNRPYPLTAGDRIYIEPYEIRVSVDSTDRRPAPLVFDDFSGDDPFRPAQVSSLPAIGPLAEAAGNDELDPLKYFEPIQASKSDRKRERPPRSADDLLDSHYDPPALVPDRRLPGSASADIPEGWDPLAPAGPETPPPAPRIQAARPRPGPDKEPDRPQPSPFSHEAFPQDTGGFSPSEVIRSAHPATPAPVEAVRVEAVRAPLEKIGEPTGDLDLPTLLASAGIPATAMTPELARTLGRILQIVVTGLMDVLQSRQDIKHEFGMYNTLFRPKGNNPLKFSTDVEDALHNLFVKRNPAYLTPVDAFTDAFDDLRDHQLAMLAGIRAAFETMLAEFEPNHLQQEFERQLGKAGLALVPARLRYWDLYRDRVGEMTKDQEATFSRLFGDSFKRAYEEQFRQLKAQRASRTAAEPTGRKDG